jgi:citrate lyase beta subunit
MKKIDALRLGGTLFVPATHKHLEAIAHGSKFTALRSVVLDTEDGIGESELADGLESIKALLPTLKSGSLLRFIRPRNPEVLEQLLQFEGINSIDGFIFPKFGLDSAQEYLSAIKRPEPGIRHFFMPSIEGRELFDASQLRKLRDLLLPYRAYIPAIRFGAEDMLRQLGLRRECELSLYDMAAPCSVIGSLLGVFKPYGFDLAAPVYGCYRDHAGFIREAKRDLQEGLVSKTIIHPDQIDLMEQAYAVDTLQYEAAKEIVASKNAVFGQSGKMAERATQHPWAEAILKRAEIYGNVYPMR